MILSSGHGESGRVNWMPHPLFEMRSAEDAFSLRGNFEHPPNAFIDSLVPEENNCGYPVNGDGNKSGIADPCEPGTAHPPLNNIGSGEVSDASAPVGEWGGNASGAQHEDLKELLRKERAEAFSEGFESGRLEAMQSLRGEIENKKSLVKDLLVGINDSLADYSKIHLPLKKLAVHLAVQLVRGELTLSGSAIHRLVSNCLADLDHRLEKLSVKLNPDDLEMLCLPDPEFSESIEFVGDPGIGRGGVQVDFASGTIDDFIENRLESLANSVLGLDSTRQLNSVGISNGIGPNPEAFRSPSFAKTSFESVSNQELDGASAYSDE